MRRTIVASLIIGLSLMASAFIITYNSAFHSCLRALEAAKEETGRGLSRPEQIEFCQR